MLDHEKPSKTKGFKLARAAYIAAVKPAGPDPIIITLCIILLLFYLAYLLVHLLKLLQLAVQQHHLC